MVTDINFPLPITSFTYIYDIRNRSFYNILYIRIWYHIYGVYKQPHIGFPYIKDVVEYYFYYIFVCI